MAAQDVHLVCCRWPQEMPTARNKRRAIPSGPVHASQQNRKPSDQKRTKQVSLQENKAPDGAIAPGASWRKRKTSCERAPPQAKRQCTVRTATDAHEAALLPPLQVCPADEGTAAPLTSPVQSKSTLRADQDGQGEAAQVRGLGQSPNRLPSRPPVPRTPATADRPHRLSSARLIC
jgi:hypothetical protein